MSEFSRVRALRQLRSAEAVTLPQQLPPAPADDGDLRAVLAQAYRDDARAWPHDAPAPDLSAAAWGLEAFLVVAHRWYVGGDATPLPPAPTASSEEEQAAAARHLCADLALRYLPPLLQRVAADSPDDVLLAETAPLAEAFPYTFLLSPKPTWPAQVAGWGDACFRGAVVDRVIARDRVDVAHHPALRPHVEAALGAHAAELWPGFHRKRGAGAAGATRPSPPS